MSVLEKNQSQIVFFGGLKIWFHLISTVNIFQSDCFSCCHTVFTLLFESILSLILSWVVVLQVKQGSCDSSHSTSILHFMSNFHNAFSYWALTVLLRFSKNWRCLNVFNNCIVSSIAFLRARLSLHCRRFFPLRDTLFTGRWQLIFPYLKWRQTPFYQLSSYTITIYNASGITHCETRTLKALHSEPND